MCKYFVHLRFFEHFVLQNAIPRVLVQDATTEIPDEIQDLRRVNLITPEHIHINSFMYEPLVDLDKNQIVDLYEKVETITGS
ncbi:MAG: hypothetical protein LR008_01485 [Candidatus Pacebacteria bacterium]|nr:hypothetical protein [Candidatus Paceibacterota bacterium]